MDELAAVAAAVPGVVPVGNMVETGRPPLLRPDELHELGFDLVVSPVTGLLAATGALAAACATLAAEGTRREHLDRLASFEGLFEVVDRARHAALDNRYRS